MMWLFKWHCIWGVYGDMRDWWSVDFSSLSDRLDIVKEFTGWQILQHDGILQHKILVSRAVNFAEQWTLQRLMKFIAWRPHKALNITVGWILSAADSSMVNIVCRMTNSMIRMLQCDEFNAEMKYSLTSAVWWILWCDRHYSEKFYSHTDCKLHSLTDLTAWCSLQCDRSFCVTADTKQIL